MKGLITVLAVLVVVGLAYFLYRSPTVPPEMTEAEVAQMEVDARAGFADLVAGYGNVLIARDVQAIPSFWTSDARGWQPGSSFTAGDLAALTEEDFAGRTFTAVDARILDIFVHGDVAYVINEWSDEVQYEGQEPGTGTSICFTRLEREDGAWKFDRDVCGPRDAPAEG